MARKQKQSVEQYEHAGEERANNPPVGLVTPQTDPDQGTRKSYQYDPHLDPQLQWAGKAEHTSFDVPTVSLHVHERIDPKTIIDAVRKEQGHDGQQSLFADQKPLREAVEFYQHKDNWSNRLVAGDSLLVMNSLLEKEAMAGKVQMVYFDPPYGIRYGSNFQPFVNKRDVKDGKDEDLSAEPEMIKAFRDTWELGIHSYLSYLRDRLLLAREMLTESGSVFLQISDENVHHVREIMDEVFGAENFISLITFRKKTAPLGTKLLETTCDYILFYARNKSKINFHQLFSPMTTEGDSHWNIAEFNDGSRRAMHKEEINNYSTIQEDFTACQLITFNPIGYDERRVFPITINGEKYYPPKGKSWKAGKDGTNRLLKANRLVPYSTGKTLRYISKASDYPVIPLTAIWNDTSAPTGMKYVVETSIKPIQRCILMTTDPGDLVLDITCGSGTTAFVAEQWGRRWITCDTSRVALTLAKQRLMTASFDYYKLAHPDEGVGSGFVYKTVPHITLKSIANNEPPGQETLYDQPLKETSKARITGPFTVEAVPAPYAKSLDDLENEQALMNTADQTIARTGETLRQSELCDELLRCGVRGKNGQKIMFGRVETLAGTKYLQADAETKPDESGSDSVREPPAFEPARAVISFGPEHAPLEPRQVELALDEAGTLRPKPQMIIFAAFQFDPEAAKDIDETNWPGVTLLKVQMNADLQTGDLKKNRASNESFWLVGQPDVGLQQIRRGEYTGKWQVEVRGFDYFNTKTGEVESGNEKNIAVWMLDTDYDGRSLYPKQVFFPMAGPKDGWNKLARNLKAEIDEDMIEAYHGTVSLPFDLGKNERIAVKIVDDRGIESLRVVER